jgi:leucyl/phenylalanyl-tRNA--protein transferase
LQFRKPWPAIFVAAQGLASLYGRTPLANVAASFLEIIAEESEESQAARRRRLFRETPKETLLRWFMGIAFACHPKRIADLPFLMWHMAADMAHGGTRVPSDATTHARPDTFAGVARDIAPEHIITAARRGFFPWAHVGPLKWWTRSERMVLFLNEHHIGKRLRRDMRKTQLRVTFDEAFDEVIKACAEPRKGRPLGLTWITPKIMRLYAALHDLGFAHSFEVWSADGRLVGGGYGIAVGRVFYTESQFSRESNTSKMGFASLNYHLAKWGFVLNDGKDFTPTIDAMGFRAIPRSEFEAILAEHGTSGGHTQPWVVEADLATVAAADSPAEVKP